MSVDLNTWVEPFTTISQSTVKDIWAKSTEEIHKDLYMKLSPQAEQIAALTNLCEKFKSQIDEMSSLKGDIGAEIISLKGDIGAEVISLKGDIGCEMITLKGDINCEVNSLKAEIETLKNQLNSLFNNGFILRNKDTKTIMRVETYPASNHHDIVLNRLSTGIALEYTPPSRSKENGGRGTENTIWTLECV